MSRIIQCGTILAVLMTSGSLSAHHSLTAFDTSKRITLTGTLIRVDWRNPHVELLVEVIGDQNQRTGWVIESGSPNFFRGRNVDKNAFIKGIKQTVTLEVYGGREGRPIGSLLRIRFKDGTVVDGAPGF